MGTAVLFARQGAGLDATAPRLTARPAPGDVTARAASTAQSSNCAACGRVKLRPHASPEEARPLLPRTHKTVKFSLRVIMTRAKRGRIQGAHPRGRSLEARRLEDAPSREKDPRSKLPPRTEEAVVLLIRGSNLGPTKGFDKGLRSTESGIIDGTLEARTLEETNRLCSRPGKEPRSRDPSRGSIEPSTSPTLIERGMDVRSNHPLSAQPGIRGSIPPREARVASSSAPSNRELEARLGGYTRGCASAPPRILGTHEDMKASKASTNTNLRRIKPYPCEGSGATVGHLQKGPAVESSVPIRLEVNDYPRAGGFRLVRGSAASRATTTLERVVSVSATPTLERVVSVSLPIQARAGLAGSDAQRTATQQSHHDAVKNQGSPAPRHHLLSGEDIGQIHSQQWTLSAMLRARPNPASSTPPSKAASKETMELRTQVATLDAVNHHEKEGRYRSWKARFPLAQYAAWTNSALGDKHIRGLRSSSPSPTLLVNPYYKQHATRCITPLLDVRPRGRNQDKTPHLRLHLPSHPPPPHHTTPPAAHAQALLARRANSRSMPMLMPTPPPSSFLL
nr:unnamed protein product [Digitaria exilis]